MPDGAVSTPTNAAVVSRLAKLREPFPPNQISKLPKESRAQIDDRKANRASGINCTICGGWHHRNAVHLDYVGHAALTDRLLDADIEWSWEPVAFTQDGLPAFDRNGGLWIKLTVCGVTRLGFGSADGKSGGDAVKEIIGDALRNAAMRFGAALDLWHKGSLHVGDQPDADAEDDAAPPPSTKQRVDEAVKWIKAQTVAAEIHSAHNRNLDWFLSLPKPEQDRIQTAMDETLRQLQPASDKAQESGGAQPDGRETWVNKNIAAMARVQSAQKLDTFLAANKKTIDDLEDYQRGPFERAVADARRRLTGLSAPQGASAGSPPDLDDEIPF